MKGFLVFLVTLLHLFTPIAHGEERILSADIIEGISAEKNYLKNKGHFERNANGWSAYNDAAGTSPVDGTGGSPSVTCTRTTTAPLSGVGSFLLTKGATNRQGDGCSVPFTIDTKHQGATLSILAHYAVASGTYADDDVKFYIYDVTNSRLIEPSANKIKNTTITTGVPIEPMEFQTSPDSTSYRLIIHVASTSASAYTLKLDDIKIGKTNAPRGPPVTDWQSYTPTVSNLGAGSTSTLVGKWRRVGDSVEIDINMVKDSTPGSGSFQVQLSFPSGMSADTSKMNVAGGDFMGSAYSSNSTVAANSLQAFVNGGTNKIAMTNGAASVTGADMTASSQWMLHILVPITGWGSNQLLSQDADTRVVAMRAALSASTVAGTGAAVVIFDHVDFDTHGAYDKTTGIYTVKVPGKYRINAGVTFLGATTTSGSRELYISNNTVNLARLSKSAGVVIGSSDTEELSGSTLVDLKAGDIFKVVVSRVSDSVAVYGDTTYAFTYLDVERVSGPQQIAATDEISARYYTTAGQSIANTGIVPINFDTKSFDSTNSVTTGTNWVFTAPVSGKYFVSANAWAQSAVWTAGQLAYLSIYKNPTFSGGAITGGTDMADGQLFNAFNATIALGVTVADTVQLLAGETVTVAMTQNRTGGAVSLNTSAQRANVSIRRVGNY